MWNMNDTPPTTTLMIGMVGSFVTAAAALLIGLALSSKEGLELLGTQAAVIACLLVAGGSCQTVGWLGSRRRLGMLSAVAGVAALVAAVSPGLFALGFVLAAPDLVEASNHALFFALALTALFGGLALVIGAERTERRRVLRGCGAILLFGGVATGAVAALEPILLFGGRATLGGTGVGALGPILATAALVGLVLGHTAAGIAMSHAAVGPSDAAGALEPA